jgi:GDPmannose 4,6-dehydratase
VELSQYSLGVRALITGINGQDGRLLTAQLLNEGYFVTGVNNPESKTSNSESDSLKIIALDLSNSDQANAFLSELKPDVIFHLAAVHASSARMKVAENLQAEAMTACHVGITRNLLEWQRKNLATKSIIALSSQMFQNDSKTPLLIDEASIPDSTNMYGATKAKAWELVKSYRTKFGVKSSGAILFNHASIYSKPEFLFPELARKIIAARKDSSFKISLRNPSAYLDITSAEEICNGLYAISQKEELEDFVLGRGNSTTISEIVTDYSQRLNQPIAIESLEENVPYRCLESSIAKAKESLNWSPTQSPADLLAVIVEHTMRIEKYAD